MIENKICHICKKTVRISKDSFAYSIKEGYTHFDCLFPNHKIDDIAEEAPATEKRVFNYPK